MFVSVKNAPPGLVKGAHRIENIRTKGEREGLERQDRLNSSPS